MEAAANVYHENLSDVELDRSAREIGAVGKEAMQRFAGYLVAIHQRGLYERAGCVSIVQYAALYGGMTKVHVTETLRLTERFKQMPELLNLLLHGIVGWSKLRVVSSIATPETDSLWAQRVQELPKHALESLVAGLKVQRSIGAQSTSSSIGADSEAQAQAQSNIRDNQSNHCRQTPVETLDDIPRHVRRRKSIDVDLNTADRFNRRLADGRKKTRRSITASELLDSLLAGNDEYGAPKFSTTEVIYRNADTGILTKRTSMGPVQIWDRELESHYRVDEVYDLIFDAPKPLETRTSSTDGRSEDLSGHHGQVRRYIPKRIRRHLDLQFAGMCSFPGCHRPVEAYHHLERFSLVQKHDVKTIRPLCHSHHVLFHEGLIDNEDGETSSWRVLEQPRWVGAQSLDPRDMVDKEFCHHRRDSSPGKPGARDRP